MYNVGLWHNAYNFSFMRPILEEVQRRGSSFDAQNPPVCSGLSDTIAA